MGSFRTSTRTGRNLESRTRKPLKKELRHQITIGVVVREEIVTALLAEIKTNTVPLTTIAAAETRTGITVEAHPLITPESTVINPLSIKIVAGDTIGQGLQKKDAAVITATETTTSR